MPGGVEPRTGCEHPPGLRVVLGPGDRIGQAGQLRGPGDGAPDRQQRPVSPEHRGDGVTHLAAKPGGLRKFATEPAFQNRDDARQVGGRAGHRLRVDLGTEALQGQGPPGVWANVLQIRQAVRDAPGPGIDPGAPGVDVGEDGLQQTCDAGLVGNSAERRGHPGLPLVGLPRHGVQGGLDHGELPGCVVEALPRQRVKGSPEPVSQHCRGQQHCRGPGSKVLLDGPDNLIQGRPGLGELVTVAIPKEFLLSGGPVLPGLAGPPGDQRCQAVGEVEVLHQLRRCLLRKPGADQIGQLVVSHPGQ